MDQDITIMSDCSELVNRAFVGTAAHTDSRGWWHLRKPELTKAKQEITESC